MSYILIVDDDTDMAQIMSDMVTLLDRKTRIVNGPRAAMEMLRRQRPELILLDLNMPGVNGMEVCRYIKRDPAAADMPVVIVTADDSPETQAEAKKAGATAYLVKPVDIDQLEKVMEKIGGEPAAPVNPAAPPPAAASAPAKPADAKQQGSSGGVSLKGKPASKDAPETRQLPRPILKSRKK